MAEPELQISCYYPRREKRWKDNGDGSFSADVYTDHGVVEVFTYVGGERHRAFTNLHLYLAPHIYHATLPRHYHHRWLRRLAYKFADQCAAHANG